jgi:very-short-patch-repair endonuclease
MTKSNIALLVGAALLLTAFFIAILSKGRSRSTYRVQPILTGNEAEFFGRLSRALQQFHVFPQMSMASVIAPSSTNNKKRLIAFRAISQKRIDFVVCDRELKVICVIELDDKTHIQSKDEERDAMLSSAGIPTIRYQSRSKPDERQIAVDVRSLRNLK